MTWRNIIFAFPHKDNKVLQLDRVVFLRSASDSGIFRVSRMGRIPLGKRAFQYVGPVFWNSLPISVKHSSSLSSFQIKLKTHLFSFLLHTDMSFSFFSFYQPITSNSYICSVCVCVCMCVCVCVRACVRACVRV